MVKAFLLNEQNKSYSLEDLAKLGVLYFAFNPQTYDKDESLDKVMKERNYGHISIVTLSQESLPNFKEMLVKFFDEHFHDHEEIRFVLEGSGNFDVRNEKEEWVRIFVEPGDLIVLPAGISHRFSLCEKEYAKVMRLFQANIEPIWIAHSLGNKDNLKKEAYNNYHEFIKKQFNL